MTALRRVSNLCMAATRATFLGLSRATMLLPSAFHPHAECIAKHLSHLRPSQVRGLALWWGPPSWPAAAAGMPCWGPADSGSGLAHDAPVPAGMAARRGRPGRALPGAAGRAGLFRAAPALGPGLVAGNGTDAGRRPDLQGRGAGGPGRQRGLPWPGASRPGAKPVPGCRTSATCWTVWVRSCPRT